MYLLQTTTSNLYFQVVTALRKASSERPAFSLERRRKFPFERGPRFQLLMHVVSLLSLIAHNSYIEI